MEQPEPEAEDAPPPRRSHLLRGCLVTFAILIILAGVGVFYTARMLYREIERDPQLMAAVEAVRTNASAMAEIGGDFLVMETERTASPQPGGKEATISYKLVLVGPRGESRVDVQIEPVKNGKRTSIKITGPSGGIIRLRPATTTEK